MLVFGHSAHRDVHLNQDGLGSLCHHHKHPQQFISVSVS